MTLVIGQMTNLRLILVILSALQISCTVVQDINTVAGEIGIQSKVDVTRQNYFTISPHSNLALKIFPHNLKGVDRDIDSRFRQQSEKAFNYSFNNVTVINEKTNLSRKDDYLVETKILALTNEPNKDEPSNDAEQVNPIFRATIKVVLSDARTKQQLDIAVIKSRVGIIKTYDFDLFLKESIMAYTYSLVATSTYIRY